MMATGRKSRLLSKGQLCPHFQQSEARAFIGWERELLIETAVSSDSHLEIGHQWPGQCPLDWFNDNGSSVPGLFCFYVFLGQFLELWTLVSWLQSGHHVSLCLPLAGLSISMAQNIIYRTWEGSKGPRLCLLTKLLLFGLPWLFTFVSAFSHLSG